MRSLLRLASLIMLATLLAAWRAFFFFFSLRFFFLAFLRSFFCFLSCLSHCLTILRIILLSTLDSFFFFLILSESESESESDSDSDSDSTLASRDEDEEGSDACAFLPSSLV